MTSTKTITIIQEVHVPHNETVVRTWYDIVQRTIEREIGPQGNIVSEEVVHEDTSQSYCDLEEETLETDEDLEDEEIVSEEFEDDE
jgi:hypothetical protein